MVAELHAGQPRLGVSRQRCRQALSRVEWRVVLPEQNTISTKLVDFSTVIEKLWFLRTGGSIFSPILLICVLSRTSTDLPIVCNVIANSSLRGHRHVQRRNFTTQELA